VIDLNEDGSINSFNEKKYYEKGLINGGLYLLNVASFLKEPFPSAFSFETAYLEKYYQQHKMFGLIQDKYFIDIGIPEDYARAGREL
jgi:D-glycero-alpha-D-manno-heptose 1-phosphate guanylyltransferase